MPKRKSLASPIKAALSGLDELERQLRSNPNIRDVNVEHFDSPANLKQLDELEASGKIEKTVLDFYRVSDGFSVSWSPADGSVDPETFGAVKINPFQQVVRKWGGVVWFEDEPPDTPRRKFFPTDFFADEAAAGFCSLEGYRSYMYLFRFEGDLIPLYVDFRHYLQLMLLAKGSAYWQYLLLEITKGVENPTSTRLKADLPRLFPDFSFAALRDYFETNRHR